MSETKLQRLTGRINSISARGNFGFILNDEDLREIFMHQDDAVGFTPSKGDLVEFSLGFDRSNRPKAIHVTKRSEAGDAKTS